MYSCRMKTAIFPKADQEQGQLRKLELIQTFSPPDHEQGEPAQFRKHELMR